MWSSTFDLGLTEGPTVRCSYKLTSVNGMALLASLNQKKEKPLTFLTASRTAGLIPVPSFRQLILRSCCSRFNSFRTLFISPIWCVTLFSLERIMLVSLPDLALSSARRFLFSSSKSFICCSNSCPSWSMSDLYLLICLLEKQRVFSLSTKASQGNENVCF